MGAERRQVAFGNAERAKGAILAYETLHCVPLGTSTVARIERSSAGIAGWAEYASIVESYNDQKLLELLEDCQSLTLRRIVRKPMQIARSC